MSQFNSIRNELVSKLNRHLPKQEGAAPDPLGKPIPKPRRSRAHNVNGYFDEYKNGKFDEKDQGYNSTGNTDRLSAEFPAPILGNVATEDRYPDNRSAAGLENPCQYNRDHTPVIKRHSGYSNHSADSGSLSDCHSVELSAGSPRDNSRCIANEIRLPLAPPTNDDSSSDEYDSEEDIPTPLITPSPLKNPDATLPTPPTPSQLQHNIDEDIHAVNRFSRIEERYLEPKDLDDGDHPPPPPRCSPPPLTPKLSLIPTVEPFNNNDDQSVYIESDNVISSTHTSHSHSRNEMSPTTGAQNDVRLNDVPSVQQMHVPPLTESAYVDMTKGRLSNTSQMLQRDTNDGTFDRESPTRVLSMGQHVNDSNTERESPALVARMPTLPLHRPPPSILLTETHNEMQGSSRDTVIDDKQEDSNNNKTVPEEVATTQRRKSSCSPKLALPSQYPTPQLPVAPPRSPVPSRVADADNIDDLPSAPPPRPPKNVNKKMTLKTERTPSFSADTIVPPRPSPKKSPGYWKQKALPEPGRESSSKPILRYTVTGQSEDSQLQEGRNNPDIQISTPTDPDLFEDEPLYQIYHTGAVVRDMWNKTSLKGEASSITDDDEEDIYCNEDIYECLSNYAANGKKAAADNAKPITTENLIQAGHDLMEDGSLEEIMKNANPMRRLWSNTKEVEESGVLNTISAEDKKLQMSLFEIITSEASYYKSLKILKSHFLGSNRLHYCFTPERRHEYKRLFSNIEEVYKTSTSFLAHLEHQWRQSCVLDVENFCAIFNLFLSKQSQNLQNCFDVYISYCANQVFQERALSALCTDTTLRFSVILKELELDPKCSNLTLQSFLALPMQRVTRYPLLMDAVCSRISMNSPIREIANNTCDALRKLVRTCNAKATSMLALEKIALLHHQLDFKDTKSIAIVSETRMLVKEGSLKRITNERGFMSRVKRPKGLEMFLFNDMLIISKKSGSSRYTVIDYAAREHLMARDLDQREIAANNVTPQNSAETCFVLVLLENHNKQNYEYLLTCENETERTRWMEAVQSTKSKDDNERIYEEWDQPLVHVIKQYIAVGSDELSLNVSDVISVSRKMADGWYEGRRLADNDEGWFPSTYTVEIQGRHSKARLLRQEYGKSRNCAY